MNQYYPTRVWQSYGIRNMCPALIGRVFAWLRIPGYKSSEVLLKYHYENEKDPASIQAIDCIVKDWSGKWSTTQVDVPVGFNPNSTADADLLIKDFM